jgi:hypothetical protein
VTLWGTALVLGLELGRVLLGHLEPVGPATKKREYSEIEVTFYAWMRCRICYTFSIRMHSMKIRAHIGFIAIHHILASLVFAGFIVVGVYLATQSAGFSFAGILMASVFGFFFLVVQILASLFYIKAERFPVVINNGSVTIRSFKGGKAISFPVSQVSKWGFLLIHNGGKGVIFFTKDGQRHVVRPIIIPSQEDRTIMAEAIGIKESDCDYHLHL